MRTAFGVRVGLAFIENRGDRAVSGGLGFWGAFFSYAARRHPPPRWRRSFIRANHGNFFSWKFEFFCSDRHAPRKSDAAYGDGCGGAYGLGPQAQLGYGDDGSAAMLEGKKSEATATITRAAQVQDICQVETDESKPTETPPPPRKSELRFQRAQESSRAFHKKSMTKRLEKNGSSSKVRQKSRTRRSRGNFQDPHALHAPEVRLRREAQSKATGESQSKTKLFGGDAAKEGGGPTRPAAAGSDGDRTNVAKPENRNSKNR